VEVEVEVLVRRVILAQIQIGMAAMEVLEQQMLFVLVQI
jgi:hypothetical protein